MSIRFKTYKVTVSYKYMSPSCYRQIHLLRFTSCYCTFIYTEYIILLYFGINHHRTLIISQIIITKLCLSHQFIINSFCDIFKRHFLAADTEYSTFSKALTVQTQQTKKYSQTEQILKDGDLSWVGLLCRILIHQKGDSL